MTDRTLLIIAVLITIAQAVVTVTYIYIETPKIKEQFFQKGVNSVIESCKHTEEFE